MRAPRARSARKRAAPRKQLPVLELQQHPATTQELPKPTCDCRVCSEGKGGRKRCAARCPRIRKLRSWHRCAKCRAADVRAHLQLRKTIAVRPPASFASARNDSSAAAVTATAAAVEGCPLGGRSLARLALSHHIAPYICHFVQRYFFLWPAACMSQPACVGGYLCNCYSSVHTS